MLVSCAMRIIAIALIVAAVATGSVAQVPETIGRQAVLTNEGGLLEGPVHLVIRRYEVKSGGTHLHEKDTTGVVAENGVVSVPLGPFQSIAFDKPLYVGVAAEGGEERKPRTPLLGVPFAMAARGLRTMFYDNGHQRGMNVIGGQVQNTVAPSAFGATIGGGMNNHAQGVAATVPGGRFNRAAGGTSFAAGRGAEALHSGSFVWAESDDLVTLDRNSRISTSSRPVVSQSFSPSPEAEIPALNLGSGGNDSGSETCLVNQCKEDEKAVDAAPEDGPMREPGGRAGPASEEYSDPRPNNMGMVAGLDRIEVVVQHLPRREEVMRRLTVR